MAYLTGKAYLLTGLLQQAVIVGSPPYDEREKAIHIPVVLAVGDALRLVDDQAFERMDDLLDELPADA